MLEWMRQNSDLLSTLANYGTLLVWVFYAQLLYSGFRRQRRPRILINKGVGFRDLDSPCLICNMSQESIFIQFIMVRLKTNQGTYSVPATDPEEGAVAEEDAPTATRQGPLASGSCFRLRSFQRLLTKAAEEANIETEGYIPTDPEIEFQKLELCVVYIYGPQDEPLGASREFDFRCDRDRKTISLSPSTIDTNRMTSMKHRRLIKSWLRTHL